MTETATITRPQVGDRGYHVIGSDTYPVTCIKVSPSGKTIEIRYEHFAGDKENGHNWYGQQEWLITEDLNGRTAKAHWSPSANRYRVGGCGTVKFGGWFCRMDPGF